MGKKKEMKCERRTVTIPESFLATLKPLYKNKTETGGVMHFDKKGKIIDVHYFSSDSNKKIKFEDIDDVEFHAHPVLGKGKDYLLAARRASASDIASTFVSSAEEIIFTKGYCFAVKIKNRILFEQTKKMIKNRYKGKKFTSIFFMYKEFFVDQENIIKTKNRNDIKKLNDAWNKELEKYGIEVSRLDPKKIEMSVHGACTK